MTSENADQPDKVSAEAHNRVKQERDNLKGQLEEAKGALVDANLMFEAQQFLSGKVKDPVTAAKYVLPELRSFENADDRRARLEQTVPLFAPLEGTSPVEPEGSETVEVVPDAPPTPSFMTPSPASDGPAPTEPKLTMKSPEVRALIETGQDRKVKEMIAGGEIEMHPLNRTAQSIDSGR